MQGTHIPKILRKWKRWSMGYQELSDPENGGRCYPRLKRSKRNIVTVVVGKERVAFKVESQILDYGLFEPLLEKATICSVGDWANHDDDYEEEEKELCIFLDCDAILFDHMLWLVNNHDPSLRSLNLEVLMEFYSQEDCCSSAEKKKLGVLPWENQISQEI